MKGSPVITALFGTLSIAAECEPELWKIPPAPAEPVDCPIVTVINLQPAEVVCGGETKTTTLIWTYADCEPTECLTLPDQPLIDNNNVFNLGSGAKEGPPGVTNNNGTGTTGEVPPGSQGSGTNQPNRPDEDVPPGDQPIQPGESSVPGQPPLPLSSNSGYIPPTNVPVDPSGNVLPATSSPVPPGPGPDPSPGPDPNPSSDPGPGPGPSPDPSLTAATESSAPPASDTTGPPESFTGEGSIVIPTSTSILPNPPDPAVSTDTDPGPGPGPLTVSSSEVPPDPSPTSEDPASTTISPDPNKRTTTSQDPPPSSSSSSSSSSTTSADPEPTCSDIPSGDFPDGNLGPWYISDQVTADSSEVTDISGLDDHPYAFALIPSQDSRAQVYLNNYLPRCGDPPPEVTLQVSFDYQFTGESEGCSISVTINRPPQFLGTVTDDGDQPGVWQSFQGEEITVQLTYDPLFTVRMMCDGDTANEPAILVTDIKAYA